MSKDFSIMLSPPPCTFRTLERFERIEEYSNCNDDHDNDNDDDDDYATAIFIVVMLVG